MKELERLLNKTASIVNINNELLSATGGRFNIFQIIGVTTDETRLHSAFIAELLNVKGSHGLKDEPLKAFVKRFLDPIFDFKTTNAISKVEHFIGEKTSSKGGRIDIIVWDDENRAIIIENKIYAKDQECQMLRYYNHSITYTDSKLIYLTLDGKEPSNSSTNGETFEYVPLSYKSDILEWLSECKQLAIDIPLVREAISHYINLIKQLTNTSSMDKMNNEIVDLVTKSPENLQVAFELEKSLTNVKIKIQSDFWKQLQKSLEAIGLKIKDNEYDKNANLTKIKGYYEKQRNKDILFGLWIEVYKKNGITIHWGCEVEDNIYFGFKMYINGTDNMANAEEMKLFRQFIGQCDDQYNLKSESWLGWMYSTPRLNFRDFNSEEIFALADKATLENVTNQIAVKALEDIKFLLNKINQITN